MNLETKLKAISACDKAAQEVADAINRGSFDDLEVIFKNLMAELKVIQVTEKVFPDGALHSSTATEFSVRSEEYILGMEEMLKRYRSRESPEQYEARKANLPSRFRFDEVFYNESAEQIQEEE